MPKESGWTVVSNIDWCKSDWMKRNLGISSWDELKFNDEKEISKEIIQSTGRKERTKMTENNWATTSGVSNIVANNITLSSDSLSNITNTICASADWTKLSCTTESCAIEKEKQEFKPAHSITMLTSSEHEELAWEQAGTGINIYEIRRIKNKIKIKKLLFRKDDCNDPYYTFALYSYSIKPYPIDCIITDAKDRETTFMWPDKVTTKMTCPRPLTYGYFGDELRIMAGFKRWYSNKLIFKFIRKKELCILKEEQEKCFREGREKQKKVNKEFHERKIREKAMEKYVELKAEKMAKGWILNEYNPCLKFRK